MSKIFKQLAIAVMTTAIAISGTATTTTTPLPKVTAQAATTAKQSITLNLKKTTMYVGEADTLSVKKVKGLKSKAVTFKSSNAAIVSVNSKGKVSAKKVGKATITVTSKSNKAVKSTCTITVQNAPATQAINLECKYASIILGETYKTNIVSIEGVSTQDLLFKSSDTSIATVNSNGEIKGLRPGRATIKVISARNSKVQAKFVFDVRCNPLTYEDFDISGLKVPMSFQGETFTNYIDLQKKYGDIIPSSPEWVQENAICYKEGKNTDTTKGCSTENMSFVTPRGIHLGSTKEEVIYAYGAKMLQGGNAYDKMPDLWDTPDRKATSGIGYTMKVQFGYGFVKLKFLFDQDDKVMAILYD